jgi:hypothetical protein
MNRSDSHSLRHSTSTLGLAKRLVFALALLALAVAAAPHERAAASAPGLSVWYNSSDGYLYIKGYGFTPGGLVQLTIDEQVQKWYRNETTKALAEPFEGWLFWGNRWDYFSLAPGDFRVGYGLYGCPNHFVVKAYDVSTGLTTRVELPPASC